MIRILVLRGLLFLLPFLAYGLYVLYLRRTGRTLANDNVPWALLGAIGMLLVIASFFSAAMTTGESTTGTYVPPHVENGEVVPGHVEPEKTP